MYKAPDYLNGYRHKKSLQKLNVFYWSSRLINTIFVNIQSLYPKLDTIIHHMQIGNIDMAFIT